MDGIELETFSTDCPSGNEEGSVWYLNPNQNRSESPKIRVEHTETCGNSPELVLNCSENPDQQRCEDGSFPFMETVFREGGQNDGEMLGQRYRCPEDPIQELSSDEQSREVTVTPEQFRRFPILPSKVNAEPDRFSLRNGHIHLWAVSETQTFNTVINSTNISIRAIPINWQWSYGDGSSRSFSYPGAPDPDHTLHHETPTSHSYKETGVFNLNLTTLYRGEFRVADGQWQSIPGQAAVPSEAVPIDVWRTEKELIAGEGE